MKAAIYVGLVAVLGGCTSMSGLDSSSSFSCKAPAGVSCQSISGTYHNSLQNNLPSQQAHEKGESAAGPQGGLPAPQRHVISPKDLVTPSSGVPLRQPPVVLRMWVAPWEDEDGDLHDQSYLYTVVEKGRWVVEANQAAIRKGFAPVFAVSKPPQGNDGQQRPAGGPPGQNIGAGVPGRVPARAGGEASGVGMPFGPLQAPGQD